MICVYDNSAANPMNLAISEISFGNDAFAEMKTNLTTFTHVEPNYFLLLANRNLNRRWNNIVMAVISLANMELENGKFVVVRTKPTEDPSLVSNLIDVTSTTFLPTINPDNLLDLEDEDAAISANASTFDSGACLRVSINWCTYCRTSWWKRSGSSSPRAI